MDPIAVDVPKPSPSPVAPSKPATKPEPSRPPFPTPAAPRSDTGKPSLPGRVAQLFGFEPTRKNGMILGAAACSLVVGIVAVKYLAPKTQPVETGQPLIAEANPTTATPAESPKAPDPKPTIPATFPTITENRSSTETAGAVSIPPSSPGSAPIPPASLPVIPGTSPTFAVPPVSPPSLPAATVIPPSSLPAVPTVSPTGTAPGSSKSVSLPTLPELPGNASSLVPASGTEAPKPATPVPPVSPGSSTSPGVVLPPPLPELPGNPSPSPLGSPPSSLPAVPPSSPPSSLPAVPPSSPPSSLPAVPPSSPPSSLPAVPPSTPPSSLPAVPPSSPPSSVVPPAAAPTPPGLPEPSKPVTIEYTKPAGTAAAVPDRAAVTSFDVDLYEPTKNDTYGTICKEFYSDVKYAAALQEYNGRRALQGGKHIEVPPIHVLKKRYPQLIGGVVPASGTTPAPSEKPDPWGPAGGSVKPTGQRTFTVPTGGMTMAAIARDTLGSQYRWRDIYDMNPQLSPGDVLPAGTVVKIPTDVK